PSKWEQSAATPPTMVVVDAASTTPLVNNNFETLEYLRGNLTHWREEIKRQKCQGKRHCRLPQVYHIELHLEDVTDPLLRDRLTSVPTDFALQANVVDELIDAGHELLYNHPEFQRLLNNSEASGETN
nr:hypothetical protein [Gammaproteobacteria bacterium]